MSKEDFKKFARENPELNNYVSSGKTTWQKLYEVYDLYGENSVVWDKYKKMDNETNINTESNSSSSTNNNKTNSSDTGGGLKDLLGLVKGLDLNTVQKGLSSLDKAIESFKEIVPGIGGAGTKETAPLNNYEPRPSYRYFED